MRSVGYVQLIADKETDLLLGANMMGPHATDVIHEIALAVQNRLSVRQLGETIHAHPTVAEAVMEAAHDVHGESVHIAREQAPAEPRPTEHPRDAGDDGLTGRFGG